MHTLKSLLKRFGSLRKGANTLEYAMMISLACIVAVPSLQAIGNVLYTKSTDCSAYKYTGGCPTAAEDPNGGDSDNEGSNPGDGSDNGNGNGDGDGGGATPTPDVQPSATASPVPPTATSTPFALPTKTNTPVPPTPLPTHPSGGTTGGGKTPDERDNFGHQGSEF